MKAETKAPGLLTHEPDAPESKKPVTRQQNIPVYILSLQTPLYITASRRK